MDYVSYKFCFVIMESFTIRGSLEIYVKCGKKNSALLLYKIYLALDVWCWCSQIIARFYAVVGQNKLWLSITMGSKRCILEYEVKQGNFLGLPRDPDSVMESTTTAVRAMASIVLPFDVLICVFVPSIMVISRDKETRSYTP